MRISSPHASILGASRFHKIGLTPCRNHIQDQWSQFWIFTWHLSQLDSDFLQLKSLKFLGWHPAQVEDKLLSWLESSATPSGWFQIGARTRPGPRNCAPLRWCLLIDQCLGLVHPETLHRIFWVCTTTLTPNDWAVHPTSRAIPVSCETTARSAAKCYRRQRSAVDEVDSTTKFVGATTCKSSPNIKIKRVWGTVASRNLGPHMDFRFPTSPETFSKGTS